MADFTNRFSQAVKLRPVSDGARDSQDTKSQAVAPVPEEPKAVSGPDGGSLPVSEPEPVREPEPAGDFGCDAGELPEPSGEPEPAGVSPEEPPDGVERRKQAPPKPSPDMSRARSLDAEKTSYVYIPRNIANMVCGMIPSAKNRNDAVSAFLYVALNREPVVSDSIKLLAADYNGDSQVEALKAQIDALSKTLTAVTRSFKSMETSVEQMTTMLVWLVGERMNASINLAAPVESMDFLFQEHEFIRRQAANQTAEYTAYLAELQARARYKTSAAARDSRRQELG